MRVPEGFARRLAKEFDGRYRLRWSQRIKQFCLEQKVGHAIVPPVHVDEADDDLIRAIDGFWLVAQICQGTRFACPHDNFVMAVPTLKFAERRCPTCRENGRDGRFVLAYYPLDGDALLSHLRSIDPQHHGDAVRDAERARKINAQIVATRERDGMNAIEAGTSEIYKRLLQIPQTGYTGKTFSPSI